MKLYKHLSLEHANKIIILKNRGLSNYKINKLTGISKEKIRHCLKLSEVEHRRIRVNQQWKGVDIKYSYSFKITGSRKGKISWIEHITTQLMPKQYMPYSLASVAICSILKY